MGSIYIIVFDIIVFSSVYAQVFLLVTFFEKRKHIIKHTDDLELDYYPTVTVAIPCYNEVDTLDITVQSLFELDYPKEKLQFYLIDDGSTDNTWEIMQKFAADSRIKIFKKENGGKYTALNLALEHTTSEFFGCLDADSFVHPQSLKRIMNYFARDPKTMAVAPSIIVSKPKNILQIAQKVDYDMAIYTKKMLGFLGGIHVTPGPFSIFRKKVFDELGPYQKAHNTEDQEIALRMQTNGYKIDHCSDAYVYTISPDSVAKLYRQRQRWIYGFIRNMFDYRTLLFKKKYGTVAIFTLPSGLLSIIAIVLLFFSLIEKMSAYLYHKIIQWNTVGFSAKTPFHFDWFFLDTRATLFLIILLYLFVIISSIIGRGLASNDKKFSLTFIYFIIVYSLIAPFWMLKAIYNAIFSKEASWTFERRAAKS